MYRNNEYIQIIKKLLIVIFVSMFIVIQISCKSNPENNENKNIIDNNSIIINPNWKKGDVKTYELTSIRHQPHIINKSTIHIEVIDLSDNTYNIRWIKKTNKANKIKENLKDNFLENLYKNGLIIEYSINKKGEVLEVINIEEVIKTIEEIRDYTIKQISMIPDISEDQKLRLIHLIINRINIENQEMILEDILLFHSSYGQEFAINKNVNYKTELPSSMVNALVPVDVNIFCDYIDNDNFRIIKDDIFDSKVLGELSKNASKDFMPEDVANKINWADIYAKNNLEIDINIKTSWPKRIQSIREIGFQGDKQRRTYLLTEK